MRGLAAIDDAAERQVFLLQKLSIETGNTPRHLRMVRVCRIFRIDVQEALRLLVCEYNGACTVHHDNAHGACFHDNAHQVALATDRLLGAFAFGNVPHRGQADLASEHMNRAQRHFRIKDCAVLTPMQPVEQQGLARQGALDMLGSRSRGWAAVRLYGRGKLAVQSRPDFIARGAKHVTGLLVAVVYACHVKNKDGVARGLEQRAVFLLALPQRQGAQTHLAAQQIYPAQYTEKDQANAQEHRAQIFHHQPIFSRGISVEPTLMYVPILARGLQDAQPLVDLFNQPGIVFLRCETIVLRRYVGRHLHHVVQAKAIDQIEPLNTLQ